MVPSVAGAGPTLPCGNGRHAGRLRRDGVYTGTFPALWPSRLTESVPEDVREAWPSWSRDGRDIVFVTWDDEDMGAVWIGNLETQNRDGIILKRLTTKKGIYRTPSFSPDGKTIVFRKDGGNGHQGSGTANQRVSSCTPWMPAGPYATVLSRPGQSHADPFPA